MALCKTDLWSEETCTKMKNEIEYDLYNLAKKVDKNTLQETLSWAVPLPGIYSSLQNLYMN